MAGQMGDSNVGHLNIGGTNCVPRRGTISKAIKEGIFKNEQLLKAINHAKKIVLNYI